MNYNYTLNNDPDWHKWLNMIDKKSKEQKSCAKCSYSLKEEQFNLDSALYCYNPNCSHVNEFWTLCADARDLEYGMCGSGARYYKEKLLK